jgi:Bacterial SH3 domain
MKPLLPTALASAFAIAIAVAIASGGTAAAGMISPPSLPVVSLAQAVADQEMTVSNSYGYANLRAKPSTSGKLLGKLPEGTKVIVIEKVAGGAWVHVKAGDKTGYIKANLLK